MATKETDAKTIIASGEGDDIQKEQATEKTHDKSVEVIVRKLASYQLSLKIIGVVLATFVSCVLVTLRVELVYTLPLLVLVPFVCQLWIDRAWVTILTAGIVALPLAYIGAYAPDRALSLAVFTVGLVVLGSVSGWLFSLARRQQAATLKYLGLAFSVVLVIGGCIVEFTYAGSPLSYVQTYAKVQHYMNEHYADRPEVRFIFEGVMLGKGEFWAQATNHYPTVKYTSLIGGMYDDAIEMSIAPDGSVVDGYEANVLGPMIEAEYNNRILPYVSAAGDFSRLMVYGFTEQPYSAFREEYLNYFEDAYGLDESWAQKKQAFFSTFEIKVQWIVPPRKERPYSNSKGNYSDDSAYLSKEAFEARVVRAYEILEEHNPDFKSIVFYAGLIDAYDEHQYQVISFAKDDSLAAALDSYDVRPNFSE